MTKVLITGATGNVGIELIKSLNSINHQLDLYAGVRDLENDSKKLSAYKIKLKHFDFMGMSSYELALTNCDILFLLRPPQLSDVKKYFKPIIDTALKCNIKHIVFLSVQGVENSKIIPHHKIERLIVESKIPYTFLRPAYFMQNFTTTLRNDLVNKKRIYLPAGKAKFTLIDVRDIGTVSAIILNDTSLHANMSYELTSNKKLTFQEMANTLSTLLGVSIQYQSPNLFNFYRTKRKEKVEPIFILVMIMLHYFPRFQKEPSISNWAEKIMGRPSIPFEEFIRNNVKLLT